MRRSPFCLLLTLSLGLGGCASAPPVGVCGVPDLQLRGEWAPPMHRKLESARANVTPQVPTTAPRNDTPEPRFTSPEWWTRENARIGKAIIICRSCLPERPANSALPKPAVLSSTTDLPAPPNRSMNHFDEELMETDTKP
jgi:hypothetical protein